jgi:hypothetical protein
MPNIDLTNEQVVDLVKQLPSDQQEQLLNYLLLRRWGSWTNVSQANEEGVRAAARLRGRNWDTMSEQERELFIDDVVHEDRR